jgi:serine/threonine protein kinase
VCGKPIGNAPRGSVTSWIFGRNTCACARLRPSSAAAVSPAKPAVAAPQFIDEAKKGYPVIGDRYDVSSIIGEGGMGTVYRVTDRKLNKELAVKVLRLELAQDQEAVQRFEQEAKAAAGLTHPNLVAIYDVGMTPGGAPYLVQDYIEGKNLAQEIQAQVYLDVQRSLDIFVQTCHAIEHAHGKGVIHRDLKPSNIILEQSVAGKDLVKVVDFGIAKVLRTATASGGAAALTQTGEIFGSPLYMSPEQCKGENVTKRSDIYALGCLMYETLTGKAPFAADNPIKVILKQVQESPPSLNTAFKSLEIPDSLNSVIMRCLEKEPANRYQAVTDLCQELKLVQAGKVVPPQKGKQRDNSAAQSVSGGKEARWPLTLMAISVAIVSLLLVCAVVSGFFDRAEKSVVLESSSHLKPNKSNLEIVTGDVPRATSDDVALKYLLLSNRAITNVFLDKRNITDLGMQSFDLVHAVERLRVSGKVTDKGLQHLVHLPLTYLDLDRANVSDAGMETLAKIATLKFLRLSKTDVGDGGCASLQKLSNLEELDLSATPITGRTLKYLGKLEKLKGLNMNDDSIEVGLEAIVPLNLVELSLRGNTLTDKDAIILSQMPSLEELNLDSNAISDGGLMHLARLSHLKRLYIGYNIGITESGVRRFKKILPHCLVNAKGKTPKPGFAPE